MNHHIFKDKVTTILFMFVFVSVFLMSIGYAAFNTELSISGDAYVRVDEDIRITELKMIEATNGAYEVYNSKFSKDTTSLFVSLLDSNSTIIYEVTVVNNSTIKYQLNDIIETSFTNKNVNYEVIGLAADEIIPENTTITFQIKFTTSASNQETSVLLNYVFEEYVPVPIFLDTSGANAPEMADGLIPVVYSRIKKEWVKADTVRGWYAYQDQVWANAVTTTEANRATYMAARPGTVIPMEDINTMWVWIPRYEYKFSNMATGYAGGTVNQPGAITINFIGEDVTTPSDSSNYAVHPAFTFGNDQLAGIWVGKFETGNQIACTTTDFVAGTACDVTTLGVQVKPNVSSWRGIRPATAFTASREMSNDGNGYGLNNTTTDSHMMKNTEWGAVAYLSQSVYGKYANSAYTGSNKEVYINNYSGYQTGCSAGAPSAVSATNCAYTYEKENTGTGASTTGNIYGVYDMNGGAFEYVMGNMKVEGNTQQQSGYQNAYNQTSGFIGINYDKTQASGRPFPNAKYYDTYNYGTADNDHSSRYIKGDASYEVSQGSGKTNGWYSDYANFVLYGSAWFSRGGGHGNTTNSGVFSYYYYNGNTHTAYSFRLVLSIIA